VKEKATAIKREKSTTTSEDEKIGLFRINSNGLIVGKCKSRQ